MHSQRQRRRSVLAAGALLVCTSLRPRDGGRSAASVRAVPLLPTGTAPEPGAWASRSVLSGDRNVVEDSIDLAELAENSAQTHTRTGRHRRLRLLRGLVEPEEVEEILGLASSAAFSRREERANPVVTPLQVLAEDGVWQSDPLSHAVEPLVEGRLLPYMRRELGCPSLLVTQVLLRQYVPHQRRTHKMHFDHNALGTAVFDLAPRAGSGLFVGSKAHAGTHFFVPFAAPGDVAVHSWNVPHGVQIHADHPRVSMIVWAKPANDVERGTTSWYVEDARNGDADALYRLGLAAEEREDDAEARALHLGAAERGHVFAMRRLPRLLEREGEGGGNAGGRREAARWLERAAAAGSADAQVDFADALQKDGDLRGAARGYEAAAAQGSGRALQRLGAAYLHGMGVPEDSARGLRLLREAAELGWSDAQYVLACRPDTPEAEAAALMRAAGEHGHPGALFALALEENQAANIEESLRLLREAAEAGHPQAIQEVASAEQA